MMLSMPAINNKTVSFRYAGAKASLDLNDNVLFGRKFWGETLVCIDCDPEGDKAASIKSPTGDAATIHWLL